MIGLALGSLMVATPALAGGVSVEANGARSEGVWGAELGLGYQIDMAGFSLRPLGGVLVYKGDNDRYYEDTFNNGQTRCRDSSNGQFADDRLCDDTALKPYAKLEATYTIAGSLEFGGGGRYDGGSVRPYGLISLPVAPRLRLHGNIGKEFAAIGVRGSF